MARFSCSFVRIWLDAVRGRRVTPDVGRVWPATTGLVLVSEVRDAGGGGWYAKVVYRCEVGGHVCGRSRIAAAFEQENRSFRARKQLAAHLPVIHILVLLQARCYGGGLNCGSVVDRHGN